MKKFFLFLSLIISFVIIAGLLGCVSSFKNWQVPQPDQSTEENAVPLVSKVRFYDVPDGVQRYTDAEVYVGGKALPLYGVMVNTSQVWTPNNYSRVLNGAGLFELEGKAELTVKLSSGSGENSVVRPLSANITPEYDKYENTVKFTISSAGEYVLEINGDKNRAIHLFVSSYGDNEINGYENVIYFGAGLHTAETSSYIDGNNTVTVKSNTLVYLDDGAVVRAKFVSDSSKNIAVAGRGIIDGSVFDRNAEKGTVTVPLDFNYCTDVLLKDFTVLDPAGWCVNFYFIENSEIDNIKIISSRSNGDGISLQSCKDVTVDGCFVRTWDDSLVVKNYPKWSDKSIHGSTENIIFKNCTVWTDLAQSMEIGYETVGTVLRKVTFENITVLHALHQAAISIHNANNADVENITYKNITVENGAAASNPNGLIDIRNLYSETWSSQHTVTSLGSINGVTIENLKIISAEALTLTLGGCRDVRAGYESEHWVKGITIAGVSLSDNILSVKDCKLTNTGYFENFSFRQLSQVTGAEFLFSQTQDGLEKYGGECEVNFIANA